MVTINNEYLAEVFNYLATIDNILSKEVKQVVGNKYHLDKIVPEQIVKVYSQKEKTAVAFADNLTRTAYENSVVSLVAAFERVAFAKYKTSYGKIKSIVGSPANKPLAYYKSRESFVNGSIDKLAGIIGLLEGHISADLLVKLDLIKNHRNYIAHGKRDSAPPAVELKLSEIAQTLDEVIKEIES